MTTLTFELKKTTQGAVVFQENDSEDAVGSLYVRKAFLGRVGKPDASQAIVTIEFA